MANKKVISLILSVACCLTLIAMGVVLLVLYSDIQPQLQEKTQRLQQVDSNATEQRLNNEIQRLEEELKTNKQLINKTTQRLQVDLSATEQRLDNENQRLKEELKTKEQQINNMEKLFEDHKTKSKSQFSVLTNQLDVLSRITSCKDVPRMLGHTRGGTYLIRPSSSLPAFNVRCSFSADTATTSVEHNSEGEIAVSDCGPRKCYNRIISYTATIPQIRALIALDGRCRQYIKYRCKGSVINWEGAPVAGWESWNGTMRDYWGGSGGRTGYCACGVAGTCADTSKKCNCDKNDIVWREDSGYLTQEDDLPVTKLYFGDADHADESGYHTLGSLTCEQTL